MKKALVLIGFVTVYGSTGCDFPSPQPQKLGKKNSFL